jgi:hypothetical protein
MALQEIQIGKKFTFAVPNTLVRSVSGNFSGDKVRAEVLNSHKTDRVSIEPVKIEVNGSECKLHFRGGTQNSPVEIILHEDMSENRIEEACNLREEIANSYKKLLIPFPMASNALTFDQSYYTRGLGQLQVAAALERNLGKNLAGEYNLFSGMGFGAIMAAYFALGKDTSSLKEWWARKLNKAVKSGMSEIVNGRKSPRKVKSALRKLFLDETKRPLLMSDLQKHLVLYLKDINGCIVMIDSNKYPSMPVWEAVSWAALNPIDFNTNPQIAGKALLIGDFEKSPDSLLRLGNNHLRITSICSPVRVYNHGKRKRSMENLAMIMKEVNFQKEQNSDLGVTKLECSPIDNIKKYDTSRKGLTAAIHSANGVL